MGVGVVFQRCIIPGNGERPALMGSGWWVGDADGRLSVSVRLSCGLLSHIAPSDGRLPGQFLHSTRYACLSVTTLSVNIFLQLRPLHYRQMARRLTLEWTQIPRLSFHLSPPPSPGVVSVPSCASLIARFPSLRRPRPPPHSVARCGFSAYLIQNPISEVELIIASNR